MYRDRRTLCGKRPGSYSTGSGPAPAVPVNTVPPVISGVSPYYVGSTVNTTDGTWTNSPTGYTYQWKIGGVNISGATSNSLVIPNDLTGTQIIMGGNLTCEVLASNGTGPAVSPAASNTLIVFSPNSITGLTCWIDPADTGTITQIAGAVSQINDKTANGNNLTQPTGARQPTTGTRTINSRSVLDCDGSSDSMIGGAGLMAISNGDNTGFFVWATDNTTPEQRFIDGSPGSSFRYGASINTTAGNQSTISNSASAFSNYAAAFDTNQHLTMWVRSGASQVGYYDSNAGSAAVGANLMMVNLRFFSRNDSVATFFDGRGGEILLYSAAVSGSDKALLEGYARSKWATP